MDYACQTDIGQVRQVNQDRVFCDKNSNNEVLMMVCDGMGGHQAGEQASFLAISYISEQFKHHYPFLNVNKASEWINEVVHKANSLIFQDGQTNLEHKGMGTTLVLALIIEDEAIICHVGDSRCYLFDDTLTQLTQDHTYVNMLVETGSITKEQAKNHPRKNVLMKALGVFEDLVLSFQVISFKKGTLLLCSDGFYNSLEDEQIIDLVSKKISSQECVRLGIEQANIYGGYDNIALAILKKGDDVNE